MEFNENDYTRIQGIIDFRAREIFTNIFNEYFKYIKDDKSKVADLLDKNKMQIDDNNNLVSVGRIAIVERKTDEVMNDFGDIANVPAGHGGRHKKDNMIHLYPYSPSLSYLATNIEEIIELLINKIVEHEIFHFYIKTDVCDDVVDESDIDKKFKDLLTEGIIQTFTNEYMKKYNSNGPQSGYVQEILLVNDIINDLHSQGYDMEQVRWFLFNDNYRVLINRCKNGNKIKTNYLERKRKFDYIINKLKLLFSYDKDLLRNLIERFKKITDMEELYNQFAELLSFYGFDSSYLIELDSVFNKKSDGLKEK